MRRAVLLTLPVLAGAALAAFVPAGHAPAAEPDVTHVDRDLGYRCEFSSGTQPVDLGVTADVPASGFVGLPVVPSAAAVTLSVGQPALADLTGIGAASVGAVVRMDLTITQGDTAATTTWSGVRTETTPIPAGEDGVLALDVPLEPPPPVVAAARGDVVIAAAGLTVTLTGYTADGVVTEPPTVDLACTLSPDQKADLATVTMSDVDEQAPGAPAPPPGAVVVGPGTAGTPPSSSAKAVEIPADCEEIDPPKPANSRYCAYVTGYANVAKLNASVLQPPGIVNIGPTNFSPLTCDPPTPPILCQQANLLANQDGRPVMPEVSSSLLPFGFVPTTAKLQLTQTGLGFADVRLHPTNPAFSSATVTGTYVARLYGATVNGVALDLGPNCRTATPIDVDVFGKPPTYLLTGGGPLSGMVTIPPFTGCGVTEDLDPLITGLVSGPGNFVKLTQGPICTINGNNFGCPPKVPAPQT
jgi:Family of unknown function (DUF6801)